MRTLFALVGMLLFAFSPVHGTSLGQPAAVVASPRFAFGAVVDGTVLSHAFLIRNDGTAPLSISDVKTSCGCTTADYTREIAPGSTGRIEIRGNTNGYGGRPFSKTITVYTNDPKQEKITLYISGDVTLFARIDPERVFLNGRAGEPLQAKVTLTFVDGYPFTVTSTHSRFLTGKVTYDLKPAPTGYILTVKNLLQEKGRYHGTIVLTTDNPAKREIAVFVTGKIGDGK